MSKEEAPTYLVSTQQIPYDEKEKSHLCFSFMDCTTCFPIVFSVKFLQLAHVFSQQYHHHPDTLFTTLISSSEDHFTRSDNGIAVATDGYLYVSAQSTKMLNYRLADLRVPKLLIGSLAVFPHLDLRPMNNPKVTPIVVEINQCIYVLSRHHGYGPGQVDEGAFEAYHLSTCQWESLPTPACMSSLHEKCMSAIISYFVYDKYMCISTGKESYSFNTETGRWESCHLFSGARFHYKTALTYKNHLLFTTDAGVTLCASKIVGGKVARKSTEILSDIWTPAEYGYNNFLVHLGGGKFCLTFRDFDLLHFAKFRIVNGENGKLTCEKADVELSSLKLRKDGLHYVYPLHAVAF